MTFNEAMGELRKGKNVRMVDWAKDQYIKEGEGGYVTWPDSSGYNPHISHITDDWEEYYYLKPGNRFARDGKIYRLVSASPSRWSLVDVDDWCIIYGDLTSDYLVDRIRNGALEKLD